MWKIKLIPNEQRTARLNWNKYLLLTRVSIKLQTQETVKTLAGYMLGTWSVLYTLFRRSKFSINFVTRVT